MNTTATTTTMENEDWNQEGEDANTFTETCECGEHLGGRTDWTEEEFDEHPDRDEGYDADGDWHCPECRTE